MFLPVYGRPPSYYENSPYAASEHELVDMSPQGPEAQNTSDPKATVQDMEAQTPSDGGQPSSPSEGESKSIWLSFCRFVQRWWRDVLTNLCIVVASLLCVFVVMIIFAILMFLLGMTINKVLTFLFPDAVRN